MMYGTYLSNTLLGRICHSEGLFNNFLLFQFRSEPLKKVITASMMVGHSADVWGKYGVDKYLSAAGLTVHPDFRRLGLAVELLRARSDFF